jgi:hypothetical protein
LGVACVAGIDAAEAVRRLDAEVVDAWIQHPTARTPSPRWTLAVSSSD